MVAITKLLVFILIFCILYVVKEVAEFLFAWFSDRAQFDTKNGRVWLYIGLALSYISTIIFTGFDLF